MHGASGGGGLDGGEGGEGGLGGLGGRKKKWSAQEDELLREQFEAHKELDDWHHVVAALLAPRTAVEVNDRARKLKLRRNVDADGPRLLRS